MEVKSGRNECNARTLWAGTGASRSHFYDGYFSIVKTLSRPYHHGHLGASTPTCLAYEAGAEALPRSKEIWPGPAMNLACLLLALRAFGLPLRLSATAARMRSSCIDHQFIQVF